MRPLTGPRKLCKKGDKRGVESHTEDLRRKGRRHQNLNASFVHSNKNKSNPKTPEQMAETSSVCCPLQHPPPTRFVRRARTQLQNVSSSNYLATTDSSDSNYSSGVYKKDFQESLQKPFLLSRRSCNTTSRSHYNKLVGIFTSEEVQSCFKLFENEQRKESG